MKALIGLACLLGVTIAQPMEAAMKKPEMAMNQRMSMHKSFAEGGTAKKAFDLFLSFTWLEGGTVSQPHWLGDGCKDMSKDLLGCWRKISLGPITFHEGLVSVDRAANKIEIQFKQPTWIFKEPPRAVLTFLESDKGVLIDWRATYVTQPYMGEVGYNLMNFIGQSVFDDL